MMGKEYDCGQNVKSANKTSVNKKAARKPDDYNEYLDEDFVGKVAQLALKRGGWNTAKANASAVMDRYRALLAMWEI